jgi:ABC-type polysaccharide/polyol phosphate export permease
MLILARLGIPYTFPAHLLYFLWVCCVYYLFGVGMGLVLAGLSGPLPRLGSLIGLISMPLYMLSGVVFSFRSASPEINAILQFNPLMHLVECGRELISGAIGRRRASTWLTPRCGR